MENRNLLVVILIGVVTIIFLQVLAYHGPTPEETLNAIKCAEKARILAEEEGHMVFVRCDDAGVTP